MRDRLVALAKTLSGKNVKAFEDKFLKKIHCAINTQRYDTWNEIITYFLLFRSINPSRCKRALIHLQEIQPSEIGKHRVS